MRSKLKFNLLDTPSALKGFERKIQEFSSIDLEGLKRVSLLKRFDTKYLLHKDSLEKFLDSILSEYFVLEIKKQRSFKYETLYFDTECFKFYEEHHNKKKNRYKIRMRYYVDSGSTFFEIKHKNNKGKTTKHRLPILKISDHFSGEMINFIKEKTCLENYNFNPALFTVYDRITLVKKDFSERVTIDTDLHFKRGFAESRPFNDLVIIEQKRSRENHSSNLVERTIKAFGRKERFSKYCMGSSYLYPDHTKNNFKAQLKKIDKILAR